MPVNRRDLLTAAALAGGAAGAVIVGDMSLSSAPKAASSKPEGQVAGVQRTRVGAIEVTALSDGYIDLDPKLLPKADDAEVERLLQKAFLPKGKVRGAVNTYAINDGERLVLVDAGGRDLLGPTMGRLPDAMKQAGLDASSVDAVYLTHMHPDHIGGLVNEDGSAFFDKAEIVVSQDDWAYWTSDDVKAQAPESAHRFFEAAQAAVKPYEDRITRFSPERPLLQGPAPIAMPGHTPGHTGFLVEDGGEQMLIWGDIVHAAALQFAHPEWGIAFDVDQDLAAKTRARVFDMAASDGLKVAGMHLPFPGFGHVAKTGSAYEFVASPWQYEM